MKYLFALILIVGSNNIAQNLIGGTVLVGIWTENEVVIGADGRVNNIINPTEYSQTCKIFSVNNMVFAVSGLPRYSPTNLDVISSIKRICEANELLDDVINSIQNDLSKEVSIALEDLIWRYPKLSKKTISDLSIGILLGGTRKGVHSLFSILFKFVTDEPTPKLETDIKYVPIESDTVGWMYFGAGHSDYATEYAESNQEFIYKNPRTAVEKLLLIQIKKDNRNCGLPISIVSLKNNRVEWIKKSNFCAEANK